MPDVTDVHRNWFNGDRVTFKFHGMSAVVYEPWGDNSRYWVGLESPDESPEIHITPLHEAFKNHHGFLVATLWQRTFFSAVVMLLLASCGFVPEKVSWSDARLAPMIKAIEAVDRSSLGFTPIDPNSTVRLESRSRQGYDAMLHIDGQTLRNHRLPQDARRLQMDSRAGGIYWTQNLHER